MSDARPRERKGSPIPTTTRAGSGEQRRDGGRQETRRRLLAAAERCFAARGVEQVTTAEIAAEAGVATATFYAYLPGKDAALAEIVADRLDELVDTVAAELSAERLLDDGLDATLTAAVETAAAGYRRHGAVIRAALARVGDDATIRSVYWSRHARALEAIDRLLRRAAAAGMAPDPPAPGTAEALLVLTEGLSHPVCLGARGEQAARDARHRLAQAMRALVAGG